MKTLYLLLVILAVIISLDFELQPAHADDPNGISIQNITVQPYAVKVGEVFTVNATLVNNSSNTVSVEHGACEAPFSITFDNHVHVHENKLNCTSQMILQRLDPSEKILATSPYLNFIYKAVGNGNSSAAATFSYLKWDPATQSNSEKTISKPFSFTIYDNNANTQILHHGGPPFTFQKLSPLKQFKSGIVTNDVKCVQGFQLVIKAEDGSPACVKPQTTQKLVERGWAKQESYYVDPHMSPKVSLYDYFYDGIDKDNTTVSINNRTYYQTTLNYTVDNLRKDTSIQFHGVTFDFPDGIVNTPGGSMIILDVTFSDGYEETYGKKILNQDGSGSGSGIAIPSKFGPPVITSITVLSNHAMPQAGITIYHDKIKLLVSK